MQLVSWKRISIFLHSEIKQNSEISPQTVDKSRGKHS